MRTNRFFGSSSIRSLTTEKGPDAESSASIVLPGCRTISVSPTTSTSPRAIRAVSKSSFPVGGETVGDDDGRSAAVPVLDPSGQRGQAGDIVDAGQIDFGNFDLRRPAPGGAWPPLPSRLMPGRIELKPPSTRGTGWPNELTSGLRRRCGPNVSFVYVGAPGSPVTVSPATVTT